MHPPCIRTANTANYHRKLAETVSLIEIASSCPNRTSKRRWCPFYRGDWACASTGKRGRLAVLFSSPGFPASQRAGKSWLVTRVFLLGNRPKRRPNDPRATRMINISTIKHRTIEANVIAFAFIVIVYYHYIWSLSLYLSLWLPLSLSLALSLSVTLSWFRLIGLPACCVYCFNIDLLRLHQLSCILLSIYFIYFIIVF